jgi:hypothetical protein
LYFRVSASTSLRRPLFCEGKLLKPAERSWPQAGRWIGGRLAEVMVVGGGPLRRPLTSHRALLTGTDVPGAVPPTGLGARTRLRVRRGLGLSPATPSRSSPRILCLIHDNDARRLPPPEIPAKHADLVLLLARTGGRISRCSTPSTAGSATTPTDIRNCDSRNPKWRPDYSGSRSHEGPVGRPPRRRAGNGRDATNVVNTIVNPPLRRGFGGARNVPPAILTVPVSR